MALTNALQDALYVEAKRKRFPVCANFELLPVCNLHCRMCYIQTDMQEVKRLGGLKTPEQWLELARQMREEGTLFLLLTGGEVFLYPEFKRLYIELCKMGFWITINTNATMIDEEVVSWLREYPPKLMSISLYGASNETYEMICGRKGMFDRLDNAVRLLLKNRIRLELKTVYTPLNVHDFDACWAYAGRLGVYYEAVNYVFPVQRKPKQEEQIRFDALQSAKLALRINRKKSTEEIFVKRVLGHLQKYEDTRRNEPKPLYGFTCGAANNSCWITWRGEMTPCAMLENPSVRPFEIGFSQAWKELKAKSDQILMSPRCSGCDKRSVCTVCPASCLAESGSYEKHSPYHCTMIDYTLREMNSLVREWGMEDRIIRREETL